MNSQIEHMRRRARKLQAESAAARRRYPESFRAQVAAVVAQLRDKGDSWSTIEEALGIPTTTLVRWHRDSSLAEPTQMVRVQLREEPTAPSSELAVVNPAGFRLEGLDLDTALEAMRRLQ